MTDQQTKECPKCGSPDPKKHPAMQFEGEVQICNHPWHTASAPVDGDLREKIARIMNTEPLSRDERTERILALLPARTPEADAEKIAFWIFHWCQKEGGPDLRDRTNAKDLAGFLAANLLRVREACAPEYIRIACDRIEAAQKGARQ